MAHLRRVDNISFSFGSNRNKGQKRINHFLFCRFYDSKHPDAWNKWQNHILLGEKVFRNSFVFVCTSQTKRYAIMRTIWSSILLINLLLNGIDQNRVSRQMKSFQNWFMNKQNEWQRFDEHSVEFKWIYFGNGVTWDGMWLCQMTVLSSNTKKTTCKLANAFNHCDSVCGFITASCD